MIIITARWKAKADKISDLKSCLEEMVEQVRQNEPDCFEYILQQHQSDPSHFLFYEQYVSKAAVDSHVATAHFKKLMSETASLIEEEVKIDFYNLIQ